MRLASETPIPIEREAFLRMLDFVRLTDRMTQSPEYTALLEPLLPPAAHVVPERPPVLMGYDFHLGPDGPKLIEINNNAGGLYVQGYPWIPQPDIPELPGSLASRLLEMFPPSLRRIAIMDENIEHQPMYPEMTAYAEMLRKDGRHVWLVTPDRIETRDNALWIDGERLDAIYNRHTDFYLESEGLAHIRHAFLQGTVDLNPYPRSYALLGEKTRMADWWRPGWLDACLELASVSLIHAMVPETHLLKEMDADQVWKDRKRWVFKPAARHGGKGVVVGKNISRTRFSKMGDDTIIQAFIPPTVVSVNGRDMKFDVRLYTYGSRLIAVAGRVWQGQVTNFQAEGSGWVGLDILS